MAYRHYTNDLKRFKRLQNHVLQPRSRKRLFHAVELINKIKTVVVGIRYISRCRLIFGNCFFLRLGIGMYVARIQILFALDILARVNLSLYGFFDVAQYTPDNLGIFGNNELFQIADRNRLKLLDMLTLYFIDVLFEIEYSISKLPDFLALGRILLAEIGDNRLAASLDRVGNNIRLFVCVADNLLAELLSLYQCGTNRLFFVAYLVEICYHNLQLALKLVVFAIELGIFFNKKVDIIVDLVGIVSSDRFAKCFILQFVRCKHFPFPFSGRRREFELGFAGQIAASASLNLYKSKQHTYQHQNQNCKNSRKIHRQ